MHGATQDPGRRQRIVQLAHLEIASRRVAERASGSAACRNALAGGRFLAYRHIVIQPTREVQLQIVRGRDAGPVSSDCERGQPLRRGPRLSGHPAA